MRLSTILCAVAAVVFSSTVPVEAQENTWETSFVFYLWAAETDTAVSTPLGTIETTLPFSDAWENLDFAFMGVFEARRNRWSLIGDFAQTNLSVSNASPGPVFGGIDADIKLQVLNGYAMYRVSQNSTLSLDIGAGARWFNTDTTLTLTPGTAPGRSAAFDNGWIDPVLAARVTVQLSDRWVGAAFIDYGGFRGNSESHQAALTAQYWINDSLSVLGGYRLLDLSHSESGDAFDFKQSGPVFGARYRF